MEWTKDGREISLQGAGGEKNECKVGLVRYVQNVLAGAIQIVNGKSISCLLPCRQVGVHVRIVVTNRNNNKNI